MPCDFLKRCYEDLRVLHLKYCCALLCRGHFGHQQGQAADGDKTQTGALLCSERRLWSVMGLKMWVTILSSAKIWTRYGMDRNRLGYDTFLDFSTSTACAQRLHSDQGHGTSLWIVGLWPPYVALFRSGFFASPWFSLRIWIWGLETRDNRVSARASSHRNQNTDISDITWCHLSHICLKMYLCFPWSHSHQYHQGVMCAWPPELASL